MSTLLQDLARNLLISCKYDLHILHKFLQDLHVLHDFLQALHVLQDLHISYFSNGIAKDGPGWAHAYPTLHPAFLYVWCIL